MTEYMTIDAYLAAVRDALLDIDSRVREEALSDLAAHLRDDAVRRGEREAIAALGSPEAYAAAIRSEVAGAGADGPVPQGYVLGMPYEFRRASLDAVGERLWNPADPRIFMPRLFGVGWTINFGALAVKLRLIRPDDAGDEAFERIPMTAVRLALAVPAVLAAVTAALVVIAWPSLPAEVPTHWGVSGAPDDWASKPVAFGLLLAITLGPILVAYARFLTRGVGRRAGVFSAAALGLLAWLGAWIAVFTILDADGGRSGNWLGLAIIGGLLLAFLLLYVPVRLGMRAEWRDGLDHPIEEE